MKALFLAEKPSLMRTVSNFYEKHKDEIPYDVTFLAQRGHLVTLKQPDELDESLKEWSWDTLPIHPEEYGGWKYKIINEKKVGNFQTAKERFMTIKKELSSGAYDFVINAGDPDQEGELLVRIVLMAVGNKLPVKRFWTNDLTEKKVVDALLNLRDDDNDPMLVNLLNAAFCRQRSDYRFGMNISRAASLKLNGRVACGRVKTPILGLVCKREDEIANFKPKTTYGIKIKYADNFEGSYFDLANADDVNLDDDKSEQNEGIIFFDNKSEAEEKIRELDSYGTSGRVEKYETKRVVSYAPKLFKLATAQMAAGKLGYSASDTLSIIQGLYDKGYMSYPRTDCEFISSAENLKAFLNSASVVPSLKPYIDTIDDSVIGKVKGTKKWVNDAKLKESGHSALVPTGKAPDYNTLSPDEKNIYELICRQFVAIFLPPLVQDKTFIVTSLGNNNYFRCSGKTLVDPGFSKIFGTNFNDIIIPEYSVGDTILHTGFGINEKTTTCPKRYTDADMIAACENPLKYLDDEHLKSLGKKLIIGTPATRASIIEELITRDKYIARTSEKKVTYLVPTPVGTAIYRNLKDSLICKVDMTGQWEEKLEAIRGGNITLSEVERQMKDDVTEMVREIKNMDIVSPLKNANENMVIGTCPLCGGEIKSGPKSFYCSNWKEKNCGFGLFKKVCDSTITNDEFIKLIDGQEIVKTLYKGKTSWKQRLRYNPDSGKVEFVKNENDKAFEPGEVSYKCPKCQSALTEERVKFSCNCGFTFWKSACGKMLTESQISSFFETGDTGLVSGMKSKSGSLFNAHIVLKSDLSGTQFEYER